LIMIINIIQKEVVFMKSSILKTSMVNLCGSKCI
jgi:hypothetical protein